MKTFLLSAVTQCLKGYDECNETTQGSELRRNMTYFQEDSWTKECPHCSAKLHFTVMKLPDHERYSIDCPWCGKVAETGKEGSTPKCKLIKSGDPSKKK